MKAGKISIEERTIELICEDCSKRFGTEISSNFRLKIRAEQQRYFDFIEFHDHGFLERTIEEEVREAAKNDIARKVWKECKDFPTSEKLKVLAARLEGFREKEKKTKNFTNAENENLL
jgi:hypothetical protein